MRRIQTVLVLALMGCTAAPVTQQEASEDHGHDESGVLTLATAEEIDAELSTSPAHREDAAFVRATVLYRSRTELPLEIATSPDGRTWSDWSTPVIEPEGTDDEVGVWLADVDVVDGDARYWRIRQMDGTSPTELAIDTSTLEEMTADILTDEDGELAALDADADGETTVGGTRMRRYRFDFGTVTRTFHWMLRNARRRGWRGTLYGHSTGLRTYAQQLALWNAYQNGTGNPAFPPWGPSRHLIRNVQRVGRWYQAIDTSFVPDLIRIARGMGISLRTPYSNEPWHVEATRAFSPPRGYRP